MAGVDLVQMSPTITKPVLKVVEHDLQLSLSDAQVILVVKHSMPGLQLDDLLTEIHLIHAGKFRAA